METLKHYPILAVRAIIRNEAHEVLLLKRARDGAYGNMWCLPGGKVDLGQRAEEAMIREVREETSLQCKSCDFLFYRDGLPEGPGENHYLTLYFFCQVHGNIKLNGESSTYAWLGPEALGNYQIAFGNEEAIRRFWEE